MYSFTKRPEETINVLGDEMRLDLSFNNVISTYSILEKSDISDEDKVQQCFKKLVNDTSSLSISVKSEIVGSIFDYLAERPYSEPVDESEQSSSGQQDLPIVDFEQDAAAIYASFMEQYGIDLNEHLGKMHWDVFIALFTNLGVETPIKRIISYRQDDLSGYDDDPNGLAHAAEMKELYKLDKVRAIENDSTRDKMTGNAQSVFDSIFNSK